MSRKSIHSRPRSGCLSFPRFFASAALVLFAIVQAIHPLAYAQFDSASVLGSITDPNGASVPSATVQLEDSGKGVVVTRATDANGNYEFTNVLPGDYAITVSAPGFETSKTDHFTVTVGARQRVSLTLKLGGDAQTVTVSGAASQLETDTSDRGETVQAQEAVTLPLNGRSYADLSTLVPGVRKSLLEVLSLPSRDASYNVNGLNSMVNNFQLDGIDNNAYQSANQGYSNEAIVPSPDAIQEFKVQTDNYSAEYGALAEPSLTPPSAVGPTSFMEFSTTICETRS
ncbi:carboxypeptidase-like regulatory domain-containing protein [Acidisarcina polymorpha]|uniref:carboxypeptidase-like regulatory domain-containing protein n=1 Tax=Acidisarcina polymorpha TaxID=2211140 RepID=UPI001F37CB74|nr:carboxypeptidase-like regulatory domain-containing protein [Acidisarcina polymorpha]